VLCTSIPTSANTSWRCQEEEDEEEEDEEAFKGVAADAETIATCIRRPTRSRT